MKGKGGGRRKEYLDIRPVVGRIRREAGIGTGRSKEHGKETKVERKLKRAKWGMVFFGLLFFSGCAADILISPPPERPLPPPPPPPRVQPGDLRVLDLDMTPDPVRDRERVRFRMTLLNQSPHAARVGLVIKDRNEIVAEAREVMIRPGHNRIEFPWTGYRFSRSEHCFLVEADLERTFRPVDAAKTFCAWRTQGGWTLSEARIGPFVVEDLDMYPDPVYPREEVRFRVKLRNEGRPVRADIWIQDRDQIVARLEDVPVAHGPGAYSFPHSRYVFQRSDACFTVFVDVNKTRQKVDARRGFCAKPVPRGRGWTLQP
jgi:hypothetical protein